MNWSDFSGKKIALLGAGKENLSLIAHLKKAGAIITVCDRNKVELPDGVQAAIGEDYLANLERFDYLFRSPGLPVREVTKALDGVEKLPQISSATDFFLALYSGQTVAVTGTKGKGTTATMITAILRAAGRPVVLAGNIGNSVFDELDSITDKTVIVMELSSFQLEDVSHSPHLAVVLPITAEHLQPLSERSPNYHQDLASYIGAKEQIVAHQHPDDIVVFSLESQASAQIGQSSIGNKISVGLDKPADVQVAHGKIILKTGEVNLADIAVLKGDHMYHNAAMAAAAAQALGLDLTAIAEGLRSFKTLPHRMETVGVFDGVEYVDDSYATAPDATIAALSAYKDRSVVLILGGSSKGMEFDELAQAVSISKVKAAILIGVEAPKIEAALKKFAPAVARVSGLKVFRDAVETAVHRASSGDVVLLSPSCASKDMFKDAADRGEMFKKYVHELV